MMRHARHAGVGAATDGAARFRRETSDALAMVAIAAALLAALLGLFVVRGYRFPVGPDAPVYLWWTRLAAHDGMSAVWRPGVPALALVLAGTLHFGTVAVLAALEVVLGLCVGLASAALVRVAHGDRSAWVLAGLLAGAFTVHLATGYLANLAFAALFLAAAVTLADATRRGTIAAAVLLGAAGLAHPLFLALGALIFALVVAQAWRGARDEAFRVGIAILGGGALLGIGSLALLAGPGPLSVDTSRDAFLRRAGLTDVLRDAFLDRFVHRWTRYVQWASIPLAVVGLRGATGFVGRFLRAWGLVLVAGVAVALATGRFPADRFITFGYVVPILAAYGLVRVWRALAPRRALAWALTTGLVLAMLAGSFIAWARQEPFLTELELARVTAANPYAAATRPGTPLVFLANDDDGTVSFLATRAANVIRAGMPPDRIRDVYVVVPPPTQREPATPERQALSRVTARDARTADGSPVTFLLAPFDRVDLPGAQAGGRRATSGVFVDRLGDTRSPLRDPLEPSSPVGIALATLGVLVLFSAIGYGWARLATRDALTATALAPAVGSAALVLLAITLERLGLPLTGSVGPTSVSALAGAGGYVLWLILERRPRADPTDEVDAEPHD